MLRSARTVAGPGGGKTTRALEIQSMVLSRIEMNPLRVGFVSFTRAARREAAQRAADKFGLSVSALEKEGWFRTLHSVAYRQLGVQPGELLSGTKADCEWLRNVLDDERVSLSSQAENDDGFTLSGDTSSAGRALALWDCARMRQEPLSLVWDRQSQATSDLPSLAICKRLATMYEDAKQRDGRIDFGDLLLLFAGRRFSGNHDAPWDEVEPRGENPRLRVWQLDEAQDTSYLASLVVRRLLEEADYFYVYLDPMQEIYSFAGADGSIFQEWQVQKEEELPVSYRCGQEILGYGYRLIADNKNVPPGRKNFSAHDGHSGAVRKCALAKALDDLKPGQDAMVLARTNEQARWAMKLLDDDGKPWRPTKGGGTWTAPARAAAVKALVDLPNKEAISVDCWWRLLQVIPSKIEGERLLLSGTKSFYDRAENREDHVPLTLGNLTSAGAEPRLLEMIASGEILALLDKPVQKMAAAAMRHGLGAVESPTIRVGTIHSAKGQQADQVVILNRINQTVRNAVRDPAAMEEERRVWYTGCTRARNTLTIAETAGCPFLE